MTAFESQGHDDRCANGSLSLSLSHHRNGPKYRKRTINWKYRFFIGLLLHAYLKMPSVWCYPQAVLTWNQSCSCPNGTDHQPIFIVFSLKKIIGPNNVSQTLPNLKWSHLEWTSPTCSLNRIWPNLKFTWDNGPVTSPVPRFPHFHLNCLEKLLPTTPILNYNYR